MRHFSTQAVNGCQPSYYGDMVNEHVIITLLDDGKSHDNLT
jgi:hypothetical protein